ncbi:hypothetical protein pb186bvf_002255 [Paramecium bursaria]
MFQKSNMNDRYFNFLEKILNMNLLQIYQQHVRIMKNIPINTIIEINRQNEHFQRLLLYYFYIQNNEILYFILNENMQKFHQFIGQYNKKKFFGKIQKISRNKNQQNIKIKFFQEIILYFIS